MERFHWAAVAIVALATAASWVRQLSSSEQGAPTLAVLSADDCLGDFARADALGRWGTDPIWLAQQREWNMSQLTAVVELCLRGLSLPTQQCAMPSVRTARTRAREQLQSTLMQIWTSAQSDPSGGTNVAPVGAERAIRFVRNATAFMHKLTEPPEDAYGLVAWASLFEETRPREAAEYYAAALVAGTPESAQGLAFMGGCHLKRHDYPRALAMLRRAIEMEEQQQQRSDATPGETAARAARVLSMRNGVAEALLMAGSLAQSADTFASLASDIVRQVAPERARGRLIDVRLGQGMLAYLGVTDAGSASAQLLDAMTMLSLQLKSPIGRAPVTAPRLAVAKASYVQLMSELNRSNDNGCAPNELVAGDDANTHTMQAEQQPRIATDGWDTMQPAEVRAALHVGGDKEEHRHDRMLARLSTAVIACRAAAVNDRRSAFRIDRPAIIGGLFDEWAATSRWASRSEFLRLYGEIVVEASAVAYPHDYGIAAERLPLRKFVEEWMSMRGGGSRAYVFHRLTIDGAPARGAIDAQVAALRKDFDLAPLVQGLLGQGHQLMDAEFYAGGHMSGAQAHRHGAAINAL